jgi:formylglycine-generating enzyme
MIMRITTLLFFICYSVALLAQPARTGRDYAVFFYVTDFKPGWPRLLETEIEAKNLKVELETNYNFKCELVPNPTKQQMRNKIREYNNRLKNDDQVLFFFSTHGVYVPASDRGYLVGTDGVAQDQYGDSWLSYDDLRTDLASCEAKHVLVALDACFSGSFGIRSANTGKNYPGQTEVAENQDCHNTITDLMKTGARQFCSAGNKETKTPAQSKFAAMFLQTLRNGSKDGIIRFSYLSYYLGTVNNPQPEGGAFSGHEGSDFVFVHKNACATTQSTPVENTTSEAEEQTWKIAQRRNDGQIYLDEYPNGKYAAQARQLKSTEVKSNVAPQVNPAQPVLTLPDDGLVFIQGGTFQMGCTNEQKDCSDDEKPAHEITLSDYYLGKYEVTQKLWRDIMGSDPPELAFKGCDQCPVERVSWEDVQDFLTKLNAKYPGRNYRLPTEAEWEYAARERGRAVLFGNGKNILDPKEVNFNASASYKKDYSVSGEYPQKTTPVGSFAPNALGLYDMAGNVWECCSDWYGSDYYKNSPATNPTGPATGSSRVMRGGSWDSNPQNCRVANRNYVSPGYRVSSIGFRLARTK